MKRIYEVTIETDRGSVEERFKVLRSNVIEAAKAALRSYRKNPSLPGHARVTSVSEIGILDA